MSSANSGNRKKKNYNKSRGAKNTNTTKNGTDEHKKDEKTPVKTTVDNQTTDKASNITENLDNEQTSTGNRNKSPKKQHLNGKNKVNNNQQQRNVVATASPCTMTRNNNQNTPKNIAPPKSVQSTPPPTRFCASNTGAIPKSANYYYQPRPTANLNVTLPMYHPQSARFHHLHEQPTQLSLINRSLQNLQISEAHDNGTQSRRELLLSGQPLQISHLLTQDGNSYQQQVLAENRPIPYSQILASSGPNNHAIPHSVGPNFVNQGYHQQTMYPQRSIMIPQHAVTSNNPPPYAIFPSNVQNYQTIEQINTPSPIVANIPRHYTFSQIKQLEDHQLSTKRNLYDAIAESFRPLDKENRSISLDMNQLSVSQNHPPLIKNDYNLPPLGNQYLERHEAIYQRILEQEELERRQNGGSTRPVGMGANGIFTRRLDFSSFNKLSKKKHNSYDIKMEDEGNHGNDETRCFILSTLAGMNRPRVHCILCDDEMLVFDRYPLVDGTFFLSPRKHNHSCIEVQQDMRTLYLGAVCMSCLEAKDTSRAIYCCKCGTQWKGSSLVLGTCYSYDIFAAMPCCIDRFNCNNCFQPLLSYNQRLNYFSDYSRLTNCPHCKTPDYHFVKPLAYWYTREQIQLYRQWP
ncbi:protein kinase 4-like isoform X2 [Chrysoperla carnea]|uniref:protein kinase 4-like isoform X2 n=1 Tax=Chrysoperla carnea TaxID=189513 RepID=UPI001D05F6FD|nr:protein kinase 4-like isoform X2 [Chrysoperla carnea]